MKLPERSTKVQSMGVTHAEQRGGRAPAAVKASGRWAFGNGDRASIGLTQLTGPLSGLPCLHVVPCQACRCCSPPGRAHASACRRPASASQHSHHPLFRRGKKPQQPGRGRYGDHVRSDLGEGAARPERTKLCSAHEPSAAELVSQVLRHRLCRLLYGTRQSVEAKYDGPSQHYSRNTGSHDFVRHHFGGNDASTQAECAVPLGSRGSWILSARGAVLQLA